MDGSANIVIPPEAVPIEGGNTVDPANTVITSANPTSVIVIVGIASLIAVIVFAVPTDC